MKSPPCKRIILTGFMGTGKTVVGRLVAGQIGWPFIDTDTCLQEQSGKRISDIFSQEGEAAFRRMEKRVVADVLKRDHIVVATGGGAIIDPESRKRMKREAWLICLEASPEGILQRLKEHADRPLLQVPDPLAEIRRLLEERRPFYEEAHDVIETEDKSAEEIAEEIIHRYQERYPGEPTAKSL